MAGGRMRVLWVAALIGLLAVFPYLYNYPLFDRFLDQNEFRTFQATRFAIWVTVLLGLNLLTGYSGQISLGHGAFVAVGAYAAAVLMSDYHVPVVAAVLLAGVITGAIGFLLGYPALRLTGPYLAIATLAMMLALPQIMKLNGISEWTNGPRGIMLPTAHSPEALDGIVSSRQWLYYACVVPALLMTGIAWNLTRRRVGRAFIALRDSEIGAEQMGINVALYKMMAFGLSALYAGTGGALFVFSEGFIAPESFDVTLSITMLVVVVLGGLASIPGAIFAAGIMTFRNEIVEGFADLGLLRIPGEVVPGHQQSPETLRGALYGLMLILTVMLMPRGLAGLARDVREAGPRGILTALGSLPRRLLMGREGES